MGLSVTNPNCISRLSSEIFADLSYVLRCKTLIFFKHEYFLEGGNIETLDLGFKFDLTAEFFRIRQKEREREFL